MATLEAVPVRVSKRSDFRMEYADGAMGGANSYDFRLIFFNHSVRYPEDPMNKPSCADRVLHTEIVMSFKALLELKNWLDVQVKKLIEDGMITVEDKKK